MKKYLFIDRDGTLIVEPESDQQVDSLEKLVFIPGVFSGLGRIARELDYSLVMVTNQDGLGTDSFPEDDFWPPHNQMLQALSGEGIEFEEILIDRTFESDGAPTRKPGTGLMQHYQNGACNLSECFVIGDRLSDVQLAKNLGCRSIYFSNSSCEEADYTSDSWEQIFKILALQDRGANVRRTTNETDVQVELLLDGAGIGSISTGLGFFDHMLEQLAKHSGCDLKVETKGDLHIDEHHTVEDTALALGQAFAEALGDKRGIERYGFCLPMDDALAQVALDFSGRPWLVWEAAFNRECVGDLPTELFSHFFKSFSDAARCNLNVSATGENEHHKIEAIFKAFAKSLKMACRRGTANLSLPSTKGSL